jgi:outer membrane protein TolC
MKKIIPIVFASLFTSAAFAQQSFNLKEAIDYSLKNHGSTNIYNNQLEIAKQQAKEALSAYLPQVNASLTFDDNLKRQTTILPGGAFGSNKDVKVQFGNQYNTNAVIQLDQTIYDQALLYGIKAGAPAQKIAELNKEKNDETLIYNTASAYSQILILKEQQKLLEENRKQYQDLYDITKFRFAKGVAKKVDLDKVTVQLNNILAQQKQIQSDIDVAYNSLKNAMGLPLNAQLQIEDSLNFNDYSLLPNEAVSVQQLIDYQLQEQNITLQEIDLKRTQAAASPTVSAYARYGGQSFGNDVGAAVGNWGNYSAVGLKVNVPLFSGRRRDAQVAQSKLELANAKQNLQLGSDQLQLQFQNAARQLSENVTTLATNKNNMDLAKSVYETSKFEYSKGVSTMSDLLNADFSYKQAQTNYMTSLLNLVTNRLAYERAKGSIKDFINKI